MILNKINFTLIIILLSTILSFSNEIDVKHYTISLSIRDLEKQQILGNTEIIFDLKTFDSGLVEFDLLNFEIDSLQLNDVSSYAYEYDKKKVSIKYSSSIFNLDNNKIRIYYHGKPESDKRWGGFYFKDGIAFNMGVGMDSDPPCFGRCWFACRDNFYDKAIYEYKITVDSGYTAVCGGLLKETIINPDKSITFFWKGIHPIPTYLASVAVGKYKSILGKVKGVEREIPFSIYLLENTEAQLEARFFKLQSWLDVFEDLLGSFQWERIGYVSVPFSQGAMEHANNIAFSTGCNGFECEMTLIHEFSHNWFGNLVTCSDPANMWLNEGWASYCEVLAIEKLYGVKASENYLNYYIEILTSRRSFAENNKYAVFDLPLDQTYSDVAYKKGALVVHALRKFLGDSLFFPCVKKYLKEFQFGNMDTKSLIAFFEKNTMTNLHDFAELWLYNPGFPMIVSKGFVSKKVKKLYETKIELQSFHSKKIDFAIKTPLELLITGKNKEQEFLNVNISELKQTIIVRTSFEPTSIIVDPHQRLPDAISSHLEHIESDGEYEFAYPAGKLTVGQIKASGYFWIGKNFLSVCDIPNNYEAVGNNCWEIEGNLQADIKMINLGFPQKQKNLKMLYKSASSEKWEIHETDFNYATGQMKFACKNGWYCLVKEK